MTWWSWRKDRPPQKVREKDDKGKEFEEWIYGAPPQDVVFVRFSGDEVVSSEDRKNWRSDQHQD